MGASTAESKKQRLKDRLEKMYMDNSMGLSAKSEYTRLSKKVRSDLTDLKFKGEQLEGINEDSIDSSRRLLELHLGWWITGSKLQKTL